MPIKGKLVDLSSGEASYAANRGVKRQLEALEKGLSDKYGARKKDGYRYHIEGAGGECAAAKALNLYWDGSVNTFKIGGDVGSLLQIRTRPRDNYDLPVHKTDRPSDYFLLVVRTMPHYRVMGWISGEDAMQEQWWKAYGDRPHQYYVPQSALDYDLAVLRAMVDDFEPQKGLV